MIEEILEELPPPCDIEALTAQMDCPTVPEISLDDNPQQQEDIFKQVQRKSWDKSVEARCDFSYHLRLTHRASMCFISLWQKSVFGQTLTDIKANDDMVPFFVQNIAPVIRECLGEHLHRGSWAIVTTPMRRHLSRNFASRIAEALAEELDIPFYFDCARCHGKQRIGAVFLPNNIPSEPNIIVFDDFVTTGSTLTAMKNLLIEHGKNCVFFAGINNKL